MSIDSQVGKRAREKKQGEKRGEKEKKRTSSFLLRKEREAISIYLGTRST
jgi:hypothetical protein